MSTRYDRWLDRLDYVTKQVFALRLDQMVWHRLQEVVDRNDRLRPGNLFFAALARGYVHRMTHRNRIHQFVIDHETIGENRCSERS